MPLFRSLISGLAQPLPSKYHGPIRNFAVRPFIPAYGLPATLLHILRHTSHKITLQILHIRNAQFPHALLAFRAALPSLLYRLIPAQMHIPRREQIHHLIENMLQEDKSLVIARTILRIEIDAPHSRQYGSIMLHRRARILRIRHQRRIGMRRHLYLRNHFDLTAARKRDDIPDIILRIKASYRSILPRFHRILFQRKRTLTVHPPGALFRQFRIPLYLQPPSLIIDQMKMKLIYLHHRSRIDNLQYRLFRNKISRHIQHQPPIPEPGLVTYLQCRNTPLRSAYKQTAFQLGRQQLAHRLQRIECPLHPRSLYKYPLRSNRESISLLRQTLVRFDTHIRSSDIVRRSQHKAGRFLEQVGKIRQHLGIHIPIRSISRIPGKCKIPPLQLHTLRHRNHTCRIAALRFSPTTRHDEQQQKNKTDTFIYLHNLSFLKKEVCRKLPICRSEFNEALNSP
ncbi:uncharacterized protein BN472_00162 [Tannerella sp. CAG:118]|nr:uncharacterized protein BN472_00162 [Tannerella sp. CAG:118]